MGLFEAEQGRAFFVVRVPLGTVPVETYPGLLSLPVHEVFTKSVSVAVTEADGGRLGQAMARVELETGHVATLQHAVLRAELQAIDPVTLEPLEWRAGDSPDWAVVTLASLTNYLKRKEVGGVSVEKLPTAEEPRRVGGQYIWKLWDAIDELARQQDWPIFLRNRWRAYADEDARAGKLVVRDHDDGSPSLASRLPHLTDHCFTSDLNKWLENVRQVPSRLRDPAIGALGSLPPKSIATGAAGITLHLSKSVRRDALSPVVEAAQEQCRDPDDAAQVWAQLLFMAEQKVPPLLGATEDGIQYLKQEGAANLSRDALSKRIRRAAARRG
jgi:hypothetical protein